MGESELTRDQRRGNKSGVRLVKCCSLETKLNNIILSLDADVTTKLKRYVCKCKTSEAYSQNYDWL